MMRRAYYSEYVSAFLQDDPKRILGILVEHHNFPLEELQRNAWLQEIEILKQSLGQFSDAYLLIEFTIPRMGKRVDAVLLAKGIVFVIEFKIGEREYKRAALDQVVDYTLDLKNFHEASHTLPIVPLLIATHASIIENRYEAYQDLVYHPLKVNQSNLAQVLETTVRTIPGRSLNPEHWMNAPYKPTPTIIEAAQALYRDHTVENISRKEADKTNLTATSDAILEIIHHSKATGQKSICFVTGVPGAGKTLAGLNIANARLKAEDDEYALFLSGNGPLVTVLREALARNDIETAKLNQIRKRKQDALRDAGAFIQNIHHFRDDALQTEKPLIEKIVVFDEAQRAWTMKQTAAFMKQKRGRAEFGMSEPEFLISIMDRQPDWAVIICLVGGGQEINTGEAGLVEWFAALGRSFPNWQLHVSNQLSDVEYTQGHDLATLLAPDRVKHVDALHLGVSIRSFRSEKVSDLVKALLDLEFERAQDLYRLVRADYPIALTRDLEQARAWLKDKARGTERYGLLASSGGIRLRPSGIDVKSGIEVEHWFLDAKEDVRASYALEQAATEFDIQGLELDWTAVAWDADLRFNEGIWDLRHFTGSKWQTVNDEWRRIYLKNAYRVLLTRARQGMVIFVPHGDDTDVTRQTKFYDGTFNYLKQVGFELI